MNSFVYHDILFLARYLLLFSPFAKMDVGNLLGNKDLDQLVTTANYPHKTYDPVLESSLASILDRLHVQLPVPVYRSSTDLLSSSRYVTIPMNKCDKAGLHSRPDFIWDTFAGY